MSLYVSKQCLRSWPTNTYLLSLYIEDTPLLVGSNADPPLLGTPSQDRDLIVAEVVLSHEQATLCLRQQGCQTKAYLPYKRIRDTPFLSGRK